MKNLYFRNITIVIGLYFTGIMTNASRKSNILFNSECQWNEYVLTNCSFTGKHDIPVDTSQTATTVDVSFGFFRVFLECHMKKEEWKIKHLDLSNNLISKITLSPFAYLHALEVLNLSNNAIHSLSLDLLNPKSLMVKRHRSSFRKRFPLLKVLILQRNKLSDTPKGLWKLKSLQSLDLSFNGILQIGWSDFQNCLQLENLYLKSNKIFKIHPQAFKDLKKLQVVDLSNNALTTILPMMIMALELPHLVADLADNHWRCDDSVAVFQNFISESWRKKWNVICNRSIGSEEANGRTPQSRISRETHLPSIHLHSVKSLIRSKAERPRGGRHTGVSTLGKMARASSGLREKQRRLPRSVRSARDVQAASRKEDAPQDLALAVCLSVFITFLVAFCLGAFTRPYIDRLWQRKCQNKNPGQNNGYSNEGFYDDIEAVGRTPHPETHLHQAFPDLSLYENQTPFWETQPQPQPQPHATVIPDRTPRRSSKDPGSPKSSGQCRDNTGAGSGNDGPAYSILQGHPQARNRELMSAAQDHIHRSDVLEECTYETVAQGEPLSAHSVGVSSVVGMSHAVSSSNRHDSSELEPSLSGEMIASLCKMLRHAEAQRIGESKERGGTERSLWDSQMEFSKEKQVRPSTDLLSIQQPRLSGASAEEELSAHYSEVPCSDPGDTGPSVFPLRWDGGPVITPANEEPEQKSTPSGTWCVVESDCDSDEGSLFTLSSISSEGARSETEELLYDEEALYNESSGASKDNVMAVDSLEDNVTFQKIPGKFENQDYPFEKRLLSSPDSGLYKTHLENASDTDRSEGPSPWPRSPGNSPLGDEIPGMSTYDYDTVLQSKAAEWHCSLRDLECSNMDVSSQTPPCSAEVPSDPNKAACHEKDSDICK
ncbi:leucine-rich repeat-containing protein 66 [Sapajus apella]|uniref:Leucine-rich repeat-containing protein 66 n=1 Tax=Sapajus apella TaxID=9515 RepID=A0A6J3HJC1_SAPAP|nr:leucine-rich repeat-containing protein 66 [Sapajus apella]